MVNQLIILGIILCLIGSVILGRNAFTQKKPRVGTFIYSNEELKKKQKEANKKYLLDKRLNVLGLILNLVGVICQIFAACL